MMHASSGWSSIFAIGPDKNSNLHWSRHVIFLCLNLPCFRTQENRLTAQDGSFELWLSTHINFDWEISELKMTPLSGEVWFQMSDMSHMPIHESVWKSQFTLLDKNVYLKIIFLISQPKHVFWILKRTVSLRQSIWVSTTHFSWQAKKYNFYPQL